MRKQPKIILPFIITICVVFLFYVKRIVILKYYPPICNFCIFLIFFLSLFAKETVIQKFAKIYDGKLTEPAIIYTRNLTYVWCVFTFLNFLISLWTIFLSDEIWILYNGFISYILVGTIFVVEYIVRIIFKKRNNI